MQLCNAADTSNSVWPPSLAERQCIGVADCRMIRYHDSSTIIQFSQSDGHLCLARSCWFKFISKLPWCNLDWPKNQCNQIPSVFDACNEPVTLLALCDARHIVGSALKPICRQGFRNANWRITQQFLKTNPHIFRDLGIQIGESCLFRSTLPCHSVQLAWLHLTAIGTTYCSYQQSRCSQGQSLTSDWTKKMNFRWQLINNKLLKQTHYHHKLPMQVPNKSTDNTLSQSNQANHHLIALICILKMINLL